MRTFNHELIEQQIKTNQKDFDFDIREYTVDFLVQQFDPNPNGNSDIFIPEYQRDDVWNQEQKSLFIESLLIGLPIPYIFVADVDETEESDADGRIEIIDGSQRTRTIYQFRTDNLILKGLERLPALEGAKITCGMRASAGAIDSVGIYDNNIKITTIAAKEPLGICGSGLVDAVAVLLKSGVVTDSGRFAKTEDIKNSKLARLLNLFKPASFSLTENSSTAVYITQKDIREIQLAKAAILTGIEIMLEESEKNRMQKEKEIKDFVFYLIVEIKSKIS